MADDAGGLEGAVREALRRVEGPEGPVDLVGADRIRRLEASGGEVRFGVALEPGEPARLAEAAREAAAGVEGVESVRVALDPAPDPEPWSSPEPPERTDPGETPPSLEETPPSLEETPPSLEETPSGPEGARPGPGTPPGEEPAGSGEEGPAPAAGAAGAAARADGRSLPVVGGGPDGPSGAAAEGDAPDPDRRAAARDPDEVPPLEGVGRVVAVSSGKGGVGKSTVATNLAAAWAEEGLAVGLLDGDVYGPDVPTMFGLDERPGMDGEAMVPPEAHGVKLMSLGFIVDEDTPAIVRGPMLQKIVRQFLRQVRWGELDSLVVDLPPGTGDAQLSLAQLVRLDGGVFVTTPEEVALGGVRKGVAMFERLEVPVLGVVENMSGFVCPDCGNRHDVFGAGGGERLAGELDLPFLGSIPMGTAVREEGERGTPTVLGRPDSVEARAMRTVAGRVRRRLEEREGAATDVARG